MIHFVAFALILIITCLHVYMTLNSTIFLEVHFNELGRTGDH